MTIIHFCICLADVVFFPRPIRACLRPIIFGSIIWRTAYRSIVASEHNFLPLLPAFFSFITSIRQLHLTDLFSLACFFHLLQVTASFPSDIADFVFVFISLILKIILPVSRSTGRIILRILGSLSFQRSGLSFLPDALPSYGACTASPFFVKESHPLHFQKNWSYLNILSFEHRRWSSLIFVFISLAYFSFWEQLCQASGQSSVAASPAEPWAAYHFSFANAHNFLPNRPAFLQLQNFLWRASSHVIIYAVTSHLFQHHLMDRL